MSELRPCPFCGGKPEYFDNEGTGYEGMCWCVNRQCPVNEPMDVDEWQTRPLEDALQRKLDIAVEALKRISFYATTDWSHTEIADNALKELEKK